MPRHTMASTIVLNLDECEHVLLKNWHLLSEETHQQLLAIGLSPINFRHRADLSFSVAALRCNLRRP